MKNIIILGHKGIIGKRLLEDLSPIHNVFSDEKRSIKRLINKEFILEKNIEFIINCIGIKDKKTYFSYQITNCRDTYLKSYLKLILT